MSKGIDKRGATADHDAAGAVAESSPLNASEVLSALHSPPVFRSAVGDQALYWNGYGSRPRAEGAPLPFPPPELRMGYGVNSEEQYHSMGAATAKAIRTILDREGIELVRGTSMLEWGCASGRVLRHFAEEAEVCDVWGVDQDSSHILWAKENLSPPFNFLTCTAYPHLPFEDGRFDLIYGISVFTHVLHLTDMWLMEFRRIMAPGALALFTIHDEHTWQWLREHRQHRGPWVLWVSDEELSAKATLEEDVYVLRRRGHPDLWVNLQVFLKGTWVRREWGRFLSVVSLEPRFEGDYQTLVLLQKPGERRQAAVRS